MNKYSAAPWRLLSSTRIVDRFGNPVCSADAPDDALLVVESPMLFVTLELAVLTEQDAWDSPHGSGKLYSEPQWMADARAIIARVRKLPR